MNCEVCGSKSIIKQKDGKYSFIYCNKCRVKYHYPIPDKVFLAKWYSKNALAKRWKGDIINAVKANYTQNRQNYPYYLELISGISINAQSTVLDIGCYAGHFLIHLINKGFRGMGIDLNLGLVEYGKKKFGIDLRHGELLDFAFDANLFDLITCHQVLEHIRNPYMVIIEINRILKPGGFVALSVPDAACNSKITYPEHLFHFSKHSIKALFCRVGLDCQITSNVGQKALYALGKKPNEGL